MDEVAEVRSRGVLCVVVAVGPSGPPSAARPEPPPTATVCKRDFR